MHPTYQDLAAWSDDKFRVVDNRGIIPSLVRFELPKAATSTDCPLNVKNSKRAGIEVVESETFQALVTYSLGVS
jgi:hypothetical protein